jgi:hypothetical protein
MKYGVGKNSANPIFMRALYDGAIAGARITLILTSAMSQAWTIDRFLQSLDKSAFGTMPWDETQGRSRAFLCASWVWQSSGLF